MMGPGHALTGAAAGLYVAGVARDLGLLDVSTAGLLVGAGLCAGAALVPDLDHPGATVSRAFGPASQTLARGLAAFSGSVYARTRTRLDDDRDGSHRGVTHTVVFAVALGAVVALLAATGRVAVMLILFVLLSLALRGLIPDLHRHLGRPGTGGSRSRDRLASAWRGLKGTLGISLLAGGLTWWAATSLPSADTGAWLGVMVALGCWVHCLGDSLTLSGCPWLWPVPIVGRRWYPIGPPRVLRFRAGGRVETWAVMPLLVLGTALLVFASLPVALS